MFWLILIIVLTVLLIIFLARKYAKSKIDVITCFTGTLGSGKTTLAVALSLKLYKKSFVKYRKYCKSLKKECRQNHKKYVAPPKPKLYSNIPIRIRNNVYSEVLTLDILLLQRKIPQFSIVFIDEVGSFATQFDFKNPNILDNFNEFVRFFRHYVDGHIVLTEQSSENINLWIRRRICNIYNLSKFVVIPIIHVVIYLSREINISEEIKTILTDEDSTNDTNKVNIKWMPLFFRKRFRHFDSRCYSGRYQKLRIVSSKKHKQFKTNKLLSLPSKNVKFDNLVMIKNQKKGDNI